MDNRVKIGAGLLILALAAYFGYTTFIKPPEQTGTITVSGAFALYPMMVSWGEQYTKLHPGVKVEVSGGGAGKGMTDALNSLVDIGMVSREVAKEETDKGAFYVPCCKDAVLITLSDKNPVIADLKAKGLSKEALVKIFVTGEVKTWGEAVGRPEVSTPINVYIRSDACGATDTLVAYMGKKSTDLKGTAIFGDPGLAEAVKGDANGIGYNNVNFAYDVKSGQPVTGLAVVPLDVNANGKIDAAESFYGKLGDIVDAIATGKYPSPPARELNLVTKAEFKGVTKDFVKWILTEGQRSATENGYVPLTAERAAEMLKKIGG
jgi:phosphate transport system substrate-binding protein